MTAPAAPSTAAPPSQGPPRVSVSPFRSARTVAILTLLSRVLGMARDMAMAAAFGFGTVSDAFWFAFTIPNLVRRLFGEGAFSAAFIPVFVERRERDSKDGAARLLDRTATLLVLALLALLAAAYLACRACRWAIPAAAARGHLSAQDAAGWELILGLTEAMLPYLLFICVVALLGGALNAVGHFAAPALAPSLLNLCWIAAIFLIAPRLGAAPEDQVFGVAFAIPVSGALQVLLQWPALRASGLKISPRLDFGADDGIARIRASMAAVVVGLSFNEVNVLADRLIAWGMAPEGALTALFYANRLTQFPLAIVGIAIATAVFPTFSAQVARGEYDKLRASLTRALRQVFFISLPASVALAALALPIVDLLFRRGRFDASASHRTALALACYSVSIWALCAIPTITRAFYSFKDTRTPVRVGAAMVVANIALNLVLVGPFGESGLALATSITATANYLILERLIRRHLGGEGLAGIGLPFLRCLALAALMGAVCFAISAAPVPLDGKALRLFRVLAPSAAGLLVYFGGARALRFEELSELLKR